MECVHHITSEKILETIKAKYLEKKSAEMIFRIPLELIITLNAWKNKQKLNSLGESYKNP